MNFIKHMWVVTLLTMPLLAAADLTKPVAQCGRLMAAARALVTSHVTQTEISADTTKKMVDKFISIVDPNQIFLLESDVDVLKKISGESLQNLHERLITGDVSNFQEVLEKNAKAVSDVIAMLDQLKDRRAYILEHPNTNFEGEKQFPKTSEERKGKILRFFSATYSSYLNQGMSAAEAYVMSVRDMTRMLNHFKAIGPDQASRLVLKGYLQTFDPHSDLLIGAEKDEFEKFRNSSSAGMGIIMKETPYGFEATVVEGGPADKAGLKTGDIITHIDGNLIKGMKATVLAQQVRGEAGSVVKLRVKRKQDTMDIKILRDVMNLNSVRVESQLVDSSKGKFGIVKLHAFYAGATADVVRHMLDLASQGEMRGIILDLRGNGGGMLNEALGLSSLFVAEGPIVGLKKKTGVEYMGIEQHAVLWRGPLVILVDYNSASASELFSGAMKDYGRAIIVGTEHTFGKGSAQGFPSTEDLQLKELVAEFEGLPKVTSSLYYNPLGESPQFQGVKADVAFPNKDKNPFLERSYADGIKPEVIKPVIEFEEGEREGRAKVVSSLADQSKKRVEADSRWKNTAEKADLYLEEAVHVLEDLIHMATGT